MGFDLDNIIPLGQAAVVLCTLTYATASVRDTVLAVVALVAAGRRGAAANRVRETALILAKRPAANGMNRMNWPFSTKSADGKEPDG